MDFSAELLEAIENRLPIDAISERLLSNYLSPDDRIARNATKENSRKAEIDAHKSQKLVKRIAAQTRSDF